MPLLVRRLFQRQILKSKLMSTGFEDYRMGHLLRTAEVWKQLLELGATEESKLDFDFQFSAKKKHAVEALESELADYPLTVNREGFIKKSYVISGKSGPITLLRVSGEVQNQECMEI